MRSLFLFTSRIEMCSFGQARDLSIICYNNGDLTAEELLIFIEEHTSRNPEFSYDSESRFDLFNMQKRECKTCFRFDKDDILLLPEALQLPETIRCHQRNTAGKMEALFMHLKRIAYPCRYADMIPLFIRPVLKIDQY